MRASFFNTRLKELTKFHQNGAIHRLSGTCFYKQASLLRQQNFKNREPWVIVNNMVEFLVKWKFKNNTIFHNVGFDEISGFLVDKKKRNVYEKYTKFKHH